MKELTAEWIAKAESDFVAAGLLRKSRRPLMRDTVCFHLQQCLEKLLKARLVEAGVAFPKTHDLGKILSLCLPLEPSWRSMRPLSERLSEFAVGVRYPGASASPAETTKLMRSTITARKRILATLK